MTETNLLTARTGRKRKVTGTFVSAAMLGFGIPVAVTVVDQGIASAAGECSNLPGTINSANSYNLEGTTGSTGCGTTHNDSNNVYGYGAGASQYIRGSYYDAGWQPGSRGRVYMGKDSPASERIEYLSGIGVGVDVRLHGSKSGALSMQY